jgi:RNase P/RNase MRP subunit POP5
MRKKYGLFSEEYAKILRSAWKKGNVVTSEDVASILYFSGKRIPSEERSRAIRNALMTLTRMKSDGFIVDVAKDEKKRMRQFKVIGRDELKSLILKELKELFGDNF